MTSGIQLRNRHHTARVESLITSDDQLQPMLSMVFDGHDELVRQMMFSAQFGNAEYRAAI